MGNSLPGAPANGINNEGQVDDTESRLTGYKNSQLIAQIHDIGVDVLNYLFCHLSIKDITNASLSCSSINEIIKICNPMCENEVLRLSELNIQFLYNVNRSASKGGSHNNNDSDSDNETDDRYTYCEKYIQQYRNKDSYYIEFKFNKNTFRFENAKIVEISHLTNGGITTSILPYFRKVRILSILDDEMDDDLDEADYIEEKYNSSHNYYKGDEKKRRTIYYNNSIINRIVATRHLEYIRLTPCINLTVQDIRRIIVENIYNLKYFETANFKLDLRSKTKNNDAENKNETLRNYVSMVKSNSEDYEWGYKRYNQRYHFLRYKQKLEHLDKKFWLLNFSYVDKNYYVTEYNNLQRKWDEYVLKQKKLDQENCELKLLLQSVKNNKKDLYRAKIKRGRVRDSEAKSNDMDNDDEEDEDDEDDEYSTAFLKTESQEIASELLSIAGGTNEVKTKDDSNTNTIELMIRKNQLKQDLENVRQQITARYNLLLANVDEAEKNLCKIEESKENATLIEAQIDSFEMNWKKWSCKDTSLWFEYIISHDCGNQERDSDDSDTDDNDTYDTDDSESESSSSSSSSDDNVDRRDDELDFNAIEKKLEKHRFVAKYNLPTMDKRLLKKYGIRKNCHCRIVYDKIQNLIEKYPQKRSRKKKKKQHS